MRMFSLMKKMVRNRGGYGFIKYIKDKQTRCVMNVWVLADCKKGCTYDL